MGRPSAEVVSGMLQGDRCGSLAAGGRFRRRRIFSLLAVLPPTGRFICRFVLSRLGAYYTTCHNNGAMAMEHMEPLPLPYFTLQQYWHIPIVRNGVSPTRPSPASTPRNSVPHWNIMARRNSTITSGLFAPYLDFGLVGFTLFWFGYGWLATRVYEGFLRGSTWELFGYPIVFLSLMEVPRFLYLCSSHAAHPLLLVIVALGIACSARSEAACLSSLPAAEANYDRNVPLILAIAVIMVLAQSKATEDGVGVAVNGRFLFQRITGQQRYGREMVHRLQSRVAVVSPRAGP